jgi:hypothetical protein
VHATPIVDLSQKEKKKKKRKIYHHKMAKWSLGQNCVRRFSDSPISGILIYMSPRIGLGLALCSVSVTFSAMIIWPMARYDIRAMDGTKTLEQGFAVINIESVSNGNDMIHCIAFDD